MSKLVVTTSGQVEFYIPEHVKLQSADTRWWVEDDTLYYEMRYEDTESIQPKQKVKIGSIKGEHSYCISDECEYESEGETTYDASDLGFDWDAKMEFEKRDKKYREYYDRAKASEDGEMSYSSQYPLAPEYQEKFDKEEKAKGEKLVADAKKKIEIKNATLKVICNFNNKVANLIAEWEKEELTGRGFIDETLKGLADISKQLVDYEVSYYEKKKTGMSV